MPAGGAQPGAGRPKGSLANHTLQAQEFRKQLMQRLIEEAKPIIDALFKKGKQGDIVAIREIMNRTVGIPTQNLELTGKDGKDLPTPIMNYLVQNPQITFGNVQRHDSDEQNYIDVEAHTGGERGNVSI